MKCTRIGNDNPFAENVTGSAGGRTRHDTIASRRINIAVRQDPAQTDGQSERVEAELEQAMDRLRASLERCDQTFARNLEVRSR